VYSMVQRREKEKDSRYTQEALTPAAVTVYQTCNIMYICNRFMTRPELYKYQVPQTLEIVVRIVWKCYSANYEYPGMSDRRCTRVLSGALIYE